VRERGGERERERVREREREAGGSHPSPKCGEEVYAFLSNEKFTPLFHGKII
jgi:hypothetical protein